MFLIKTCPSCEKKIRFPLDKGRIKVTCTCGYSFLADPDDTNIYRNGEFELKSKKSSVMGLFSRIERLFSSSSTEKFTWDHIINRVLKIKYKLQNFRLLPTVEQKKILTIILAVIIIIIVVILIINSNSKKVSEMNNREINQHFVFNLNKYAYLLLTA